MGKNIVGRPSPGRVVVAMSGGVDSSVVAAWLKAAGFEVIGLTFQLAPKDADPHREDAGRPSQINVAKNGVGRASPPREAGRFGGCCTLNDVHDAKMVAAKLGIPHYIVNDRDRFHDRVIKEFVASYQAGRTPNPCVRCNQFVKFDVLAEYAKTLEADWFATGHYARVTARTDGTAFELRRASHGSKDQSYVLFALPQETLRRVWFPLGGMTKGETRGLAAQLGVATAEKPDSQEICFVQEDRYTDFLSSQGVAMAPGNIETEEGAVLGRHQGIAGYTIGQRRGLGVAAKTPLYVKAIDVEQNRVVVGQADEVYAVGCALEDIHWSQPQPRPGVYEVDVKIRSTTPPAPAFLEVHMSGAVSLAFRSPQWAVTPGQFAVWYEGDLVLGGGVIVSARQTRPAGSE